MIIDAHCHLMPPDFAARRDELSRRDRTWATLFPQTRPCRLADVPQLLRDMDADGVSAAIAMGFGWTDLQLAREVNDYLIDAAAAHPDRLAALASVNPAWGAAAVVEAARCLDRGAVGVGELHPDSQEFDIADRAALAPLMQELEGRDRPVVVHASEPVGHQYPGKGSTTPERLTQLAANFPRNRIVMAHLGGGLPFYAAMPEVGDILALVRYDTAAAPFLYRPSAVRAATLTAGVASVMFGTDYPLLRSRRALRMIDEAGFSPAERAAILGANAAEFFGLAPGS